mmetsp:Transcript_3926/g.6905  ORF Transcript_3926/g.6905 Transcript_3926/m.6905 type:complete len:80 (+) Transcript_3926:259-498(+)
MGLSLWSIFVAGLLVVNALAVLHEDRFLAKYNLHVLDQAASEQGNVKAQIAGLLHAVRYLRMPLVALNGLVILVTILFG